MGHLIRTLALVEPLKPLGTVWFATETANDALVNRVKEAGCHVIALPQEANPDEEVALILEATGETPIHTAITDHYHLNAEWHKAIRPHVDTIVAIDDLANRHFDCDFVLDPNLGAKASRYDNLVPNHCQRLCGPRYALLRPAFGALREQVKPRTSLNRILISFGGGDIDNLTEWAVKILLSHYPELSLEVVIGPHHAGRTRLQKVATLDLPIRVHEDLNDHEMGSLMLSADLAIGGGGQTSWERCAMGLPTILILVADNQEANTDALTRAGAALLLGKHTKKHPLNTHLMSTLDALMQNPDGLEALSQRAMPLIDGYGPKRVAGRLCPPTVRRATLDDARPLWEWANDPITRKNALNSEDIPWESHLAWLPTVLEDNNRALFVGEWMNTPMGSCRFDGIAEGSIVTIALAPTHRKLGLSVPMLRHAIEGYWEEDGPRPIIAYIRSHNTASLRLFVACDFEPVVSDKEGTHKFVLLPG